MSKVIMTIRLMPEGLEVNLDDLKKRAGDVLKSLVEGDISVKKQPIAFGLSALDITFIADEDNGSKAEEALAGLEGVQNSSVESVSLV